MQFKNPELLYALFFLVIPILIHLFQLRRFQRVEFTNVKFLKSVKLQTRKSSQIKKWLTLITRMLLLACVILAFAQPFIPDTSNFNDTQETVIYLDNSFSMQAQGNNGSLLNTAIQDLINTLPENEQISIFTNDRTYRNTSLKAIKNELIQLPYSTAQLDYNSLVLKGKQLFSNENSATKNLILVSDFQQKNEALTFEQDSVINLKLVQLKSNLTTNTSIDSVFISNTTPETLTLNVKFSFQNVTDETVPVSLINAENLLSKSAIDPNAGNEIQFTIANNTIINGKIVVDDLGLQYDNTFYFNINSKPKIKVLTINDNSRDTFLKRIYTEDEFEFQSFDINSLNFNLIPNQNLIILNELNSISDPLGVALNAFKSDGGSILIIPSDDISFSSYNQLVNSLFYTNLTDKDSIKKRITTINYNHPLLANAFYAKVTNFQYPSTELSYQLDANNSKVLSYEDGSPFLVGRLKSFMFSSPLNSASSNFKNSQLIVPVLYNMGLQSLELSKLYYTIGNANTIAIKTSIGQDDILTLNANENALIPLQQTYSKSVVLKTDAYPNTAGIYRVKNKNEVIQNLSFNYNRDESQLTYYDLEVIPSISKDSSLAETIETVKSNTRINALWKWFVIFALLCLIVEMLILKYLK
ncbi:MAG: hypothetical protein HKN40_03075 [Winogradskyella sp.]|uniref:BatA domain-containing protein n=1 Tax=Winogradskyella sp. TaxID=1883156 RepID=UPI0017B5675D|nr:hypothetical protein [Winogradskyella sp.]